MREWMSEPEDTRPIICICEQCKQPIRGSTLTHYADEAYVINGDYVHEECVTDYLNENCRLTDL